MAHGGNVDPSFFIENKINDSIVADADAPQVLLATQFSRTMWPWVHCEGFNLGEDAENNAGIESFQFTARQPRKRNGIFNHGACLGGEAGLFQHPETPVVQEHDSGQRHYRKSLPIFEHVASDQSALRFSALQTGSPS